MIDGGLPARPAVATLAVTRAVKLLPLPYLPSRSTPRLSGMLFLRQASVCWSGAKILVLISASVSLVWIMSVICTLLRSMNSGCTAMFKTPLSLTPTRMALER